MSNYYIIDDYYKNEELHLENKFIPNRGYLDIMCEYNGQLLCMVYDDMSVFDEYEYNEEFEEYYDAVEKVERLGMEGNYFNNDYYIKDSYLNDRDIIYRYDDKEYYEIYEYIYGSGTIMANRLVKAFVIPAEEGSHYCEELGLYVLVEDLDKI